MRMLLASFVIFFASEAIQLLLPNIFDFQSKCFQKNNSFFQSSFGKTQTNDDLPNASTEQQPIDVLKASSSAHRELIDDCYSTSRGKFGVLSIHEKKVYHKEV